MTAECVAVENGLGATGAFMDAAIRRMRYLGRSRLFRGLPAHELCVLAQSLEERLVRRHTILFSPNDPRDAICFVKRGYIRLYRLTADGREVTMAVLGPGDMYGEAALLDMDRRANFAMTITPAHLWIGSVLRWRTLAKSSPALSLSLAREALRRREEYETRLTFMTNASARSRIEFALRRLGEVYGTRLVDGTTWLHAHLTHREIASLAGTARETVTIELSRLRREGLLRVDEDGSLALLDIDRLASGI